MNHTSTENLDYKNRLYSILLALILLSFLVGYFLYMLPSLYVDYRMEQNLKSAKMQHREYVKNGTYKGIKVSPSTNGISVKIPYAGDCIFLAGPSFQVELTAKEDYARTILGELQTLLSEYRNMPSLDEEDSEQRFQSMEAAFMRWKELLESQREDFFSLPFTAVATLENTMEYKSQYTKFHPVNDHCIVVEAVAADNSNTYTSYFVMEDIEDSFVLTILTSMTPDMNEIRPIVLQSLPMICAVIFLLVLIFSQVYSQGILTPLYAALKRQNEALAEENKRQEIFMRASSHKLKTPLSAALLLLDGMIHQVGKYRDTKKYLPKVKSQLLSMRKMVEDILSLNHCKEQLQLQSLNLIPVLDKCLLDYRLVISDKRLQISRPLVEELVIVTDEYLLTQILDNLISNAVKYTPCGEFVEINVTAHSLTIKNHGVNIPTDILPHVFDPFVSGNHENDNTGHGLGLYIASYYAKQLNASLLVENHVDSVTATITFHTAAPAAHNHKNKQCEI